MEFAYSNDLDDFIDPDMAYDYFWSDLITSKSAFKCPNENCNADITCANIEKVKQDMKQVPHFRGYHHIEGCQYDSKNKNSSTDSDEIYANAKIGISSCDKFLLNRPEAKDSTLESGTTSGYSRNEDSKKYTGGRYYSIRSLVSKWVQFRKNDLLDKALLKIEGKDITYKELFKGVFHQELDELPDQNRIYWGTAFIDRIESIPGYKIKFCSQFDYYEESINPSFIISDSDIEDYKVKKLLKLRLKTINELKTPIGLVFIYGIPYQKESKGNLYINFSLRNLDYLEIRYTDLFEQLKVNKEDEKD
ncbi:MAG: hypothetical protein GQ534_06885 [Candidatus Delongbacteria bacterium]|nr:hypothetical protein [Candidatus Delongbacteria bacterium]